MIGPSSTYAAEITSRAPTIPGVASAFATAERSTFSTSRAAARGVNARIVRASGTLRPRMSCATRCGSSASRSRRSSPRCGSSAAPRHTVPSSSYGSTLLLSAPSRADDQPVGLLVLPARALAERRHAPWGDRVAAALRLALAAAVRVVDGVHRRAAHRRPLPLPTAASRLAAGDVLVVDVPDLTDRRAAGERHAPHLSRG